MGAGTMDGFLLDDLSVGEAKKALGVKSKAKTAKKSSKSASAPIKTHVLVGMLCGRLVKFLWTYKKAIIVIAFFIENALLLTHGHVPVLFK